MVPFLKINKRLITYSVIFLIVIPLFGFNFLVSILGNLLLLLLLVPILLLVIIFISFNFLKSKVNTCDQCGTISLGLNDTCMNCGADLKSKVTRTAGELIKPSETTIEVKAEEIK